MNKENINKKLILNYTKLTRLVKKEPIENFPIITNKYYLELIPKYLVLYSEKKLYEKESSALCFYNYDDKFNGQNGLWNSIYYNNINDLNKYIARFKNIKIVIEPDNSQVDCIEVIENKYRIFQNRIIGLWFIHQIHAWWIPNITFSSESSFKYMLLGIETCEVIAFSLKGSMKHKEDMYIYAKAIKFTVDNMKKLKAIIVFSISKDDEKVNIIFQYAIQKGIKIFIPENTQKLLNICKNKTDFIK